ncbi:MAG TPA: amidohydrolase family protein [Planctomycetaceae bacterium]|nr:amidohydrolase family protein [Planctomycetaceae bacterium]
MSRRLLASLLAAVAVVALAFGAEDPPPSDSKAPGKKPAPKKSAPKHKGDKSKKSPPATPGSPNAAVAPTGPVLVLKGGRILTAAGAIYDPGALVVADGKILDVGPADKTNVPKKARVVDVVGKVIIPGLVDTHSHLGVYSRPAVEANSDGNEMTGPVQGIVRALDAVNPYDPGIRMANAGGVTAANIMPGSGNVIGGQTIYVKLRGYTPEQMWIESPDVLGGLKMANGENPKRAYGGRAKAPGTRMKVAALQRSEFLAAKNYLAKWDAYRKKLASGEKAVAPDVDLAMEPLVEVLQHKRTVHFHTHRADDILTVLRLKDEFNFELVIQHGTESYKIVKEIAKHNVPVSMTIPDSPGGKAEVVDLTESCGADLAKAGIKVLVNTDDPVTESRFLLRTAAIPIRGGLSPELALKSVTINGAQAMHLDSRIGSLEKGKDADFVVLSGDPFSVYTRVLETYIDGKPVFRLADEKDRRYQVGGFALGDRGKFPAAKPMVTALPEVQAPALPEKAQRPGPAGNNVVILAGRLFSVARQPIEDAVVVIKDRKVAEVGPRSSVKIPADFPVISAVSVTPGLVDANSIVPLSGQYNIAADQDQDELSDPDQAELRVLDAFNPAEPLLRFLLEQGVTVIHVCPGRDNVIAGTTGVFRTHGTTAESMAVKFPESLLFNLGEAPKRAYRGQKPGTRMGTAAIVRKAFTDAANYRRKRESPKPGEPPLDTNLKMESLRAVLDRKVSALFAAQKADDLMTALRLINEFHLDGKLALGAESYLIADQIAAAKIPLIVHPTMQHAESMETINSYLGNASVMADAGIPVAIGSGAEGYVPKTRVVRQEAAIAMVYGLGRDAALKAITLDAARILGVDSQYGSLEAGKVGDVVLYDGDPFEYATHVVAVLVDGRLVYDRSQHKPIPLAERTYTSSPELPCCLGWMGW